MVWVSDLEDGVKNVALFNLSGEQKSIEVTLQELGLNGPVSQRDLWEGKELGKARNKIEHVVNPHGVKLIQLR